jgi:hypothetical protein
MLLLRHFGCDCALLCWLLGKAVDEASDETHWLEIQIELAGADILLFVPVCVPLQLPDPLQQRGVCSVADILVTADTYEDQHPFVPTPRPLSASC